MSDWKPLDPALIDRIGVESLDIARVRELFDKMSNGENRVSDAVVIVHGRNPVQRLVDELIGDMVRLTAIQAADAARDRLAVAPKHGPRNRWGGLK